MIDLPCYLHLLSLIFFYSFHLCKPLTFSLLSAPVHCCRSAIQNFDIVIDALKDFAVTQIHYFLNKGQLTPVFVTSTPIM